ncbi:MAG: DUF3368 domain-containing protein [Thiolinea sp.]
MSALIVADTGPLVILSKLNHLHLLTARYQQISIPETVLWEATTLSHRQDSQRITEFVKQHVQVITDVSRQGIDDLDFNLDEGETQAILLAQQLQCPILIDEKNGRAFARREQLDVLGTLGLLLAAKQTGLIETISPLIDQMLEHDYRLSAALIERVKVMAGE